LEELQPALAVVDYLTPRLYPDHNILFFI
jgi:hypothetical protein